LHGVSLVSSRCRYSRRFSYTSRTSCDVINCLSSVRVRRRGPPSFSPLAGRSYAHWPIFPPKHLEIVAKNCKLNLSPTTSFPHVGQPDGQQPPCRLSESMTPDRMQNMGRREGSEGRLQGNDRGKRLQGLVSQWIIVRSTIISGAGYCDPPCVDETEVRTARPC